MSIMERESITPDAVLDGTGQVVDQGAALCPICGSASDKGPEGAQWHPTWHCWKCGYDEAASINTMTLIHQSGAQQQAALEAAKTDVLNRLIAHVQASAPAQNTPSQPDQSQQIAELRAEIEAMKAAQQTIPATATGGE